MNVWLVKRAKIVVQGLWKSGEGGVAPLSLFDSYYHVPSGLHNEGNWHNCLMGMGYVKLQRETGQCVYLDAATRLASSLIRLNYDPTTRTMRERTHSTYWDHDPAKIQVKAYKPAYYAESMRKKLMGQAAAVMLWSFLRDIDTTFNETFKNMCKGLIEIFWETHTRRWRRIDSGEDGIEYYRSVDQALGILACLRMVMVHREGDPYSQSFLREVIEHSRTTLLGEFGILDVPNHRTYLGRSSVSRFLWHECFAAMALSLSGGASCLEPFMNNMVQTFAGDHGFMFAEPIVQGIASDGYPLNAYTNDNSAYACLLRLSGSTVFDQTYRTFIDVVGKNQHSTGLLSVSAQLQHYVDLPPNAEFIFFALLNRLDFSPS